MNLCCLIFHIGVCGYSEPSELHNELGGQFHEEMSDPIARSVIKMIQQIKPSVITSLEGGGIFMR